jgi:hypothetical protein
LTNVNSIDRATCHCVGFRYPDRWRGQERMAQVNSHENPLLERGDIYFLYRPEVEKEEVHGPQDVQRVYILLMPSRVRLYRLIIIGRKILIGATENAEEELGVEFKPDDENEHAAELLRDLRLPRDIAREPLFEGQWK